MWSRKQRGFTLIEVVMVLAIGALLTAGVIAGQGNLRRQTSLNTSMEGVKNQLKQVQNEATHSVGTRAGGGNSVGVIFGKIAEFDPATPNQMKVSTLIADDDNPDGTLMRKCDTQALLLKDGVELREAAGQRRAIIFTGNPEHTYVAPAGYTDTGVSTLGCGSSAVSFQGRCPDGFTGTPPNCTPIPPQILPCPTPTISSPGGGAIVTASPVNVGVSGTRPASGGSNIITVTTDHGQSASAQVNPGTGQATVQTPLSFRGSNQLTAVQTGSGCGPSGTSLPVTITYAPTLPPPTFTTPANGAVFGSPQVSIRVHGTAGDDISISGLGTVTANSLGNADFTFNFSAQGPATLTASERDALNPSVPPGAVSITIYYYPPPTRPPSSRPDSYNRLCNISGYSVFTLLSANCPDGSPGTPYPVPPNGGNNPNWNLPCRLNGTQATFAYSYNYGYAYCPSGTTVAAAKKDPFNNVAIARTTEGSLANTLAGLVVGDVYAAGATASSPPACPGAASPLCNVLSTVNYKPDNSLFTSADTDIEFWQDDLGPAFIHVDATSNTITTRYGF